MSFDNCPSNTRPIWKQPCDNLFIVGSNLPIRQRVNYFFCQNMLKVTDEWLIVSSGVYTALVATTNQRHPSLPITYGNSELSYGLYRSACIDISPGNFHLYWTAVNVARLYIPVHSDVSGLIYVDCMINAATNLTRRVNNEVQKANHQLSQWLHHSTDYHQSKKYSLTLTSTQC